MSNDNSCHDSKDSIKTPDGTANSFPIVNGTDDSIGLELNGTCSVTEQGQLFWEIWIFTGQLDSSASVPQQSQPQAVLDCEKLLEKLMA